MAHDKLSRPATSGMPKDKAQVARRQKSANHSRTNRRAFFEALEDRALMAVDFTQSIMQVPATSNAGIGYGDFNGDGVLDSATANAALSNVTVNLLNSSGTIQSSAAYGSGALPTYVAVGDFNSDGNADLAVANLGSHNVSVLRGNGDGTFQAAVSYAVGLSPIAIVADDFDHDGKLDLATANYSSNSVSVLTNQGDGTFGLAQSFAAPLRPISLESGDYNADGKRDLAVGSIGAPAATVLLNRTSDTLSASVINNVLTVNTPTPAGSAQTLNLGFAGGSLTLSGALEFASAPVGWTLSADKLSISTPTTTFAGSIVINGGAGDDTLVIDLTGATAIPNITYNGGEGTGDIDSLSVTGYDVTTLNLTHTGPEAGNILLGGLGTIHFAEIEPLIISGNSTDLILTLPAGADNITLGDDGATSQDLVNDANTSALYDSTSPFTFEFAQFTNPTNSLTIVRGSATDDLTVLDLVASGFNASLKIGDVGTEFNNVTFSGPVTLAANKNLTVNALGTISAQNTTSDLATSGTGAIALTTARNIFLTSGSSITTGNGNLTLLANQQPTPTSGDFPAIVVNNGLVQSSGSGTVKVSGKGGSGPFNYGVRVLNSGQITAAGSGEVIITGTSGSGSTSFNHGVFVTGTNSAITSSGGNVTVTGNGGSGSGSSNYGVLVDSTGRIASAGVGTVSVSGMGGSGSLDSYFGVRVTSGGQITAAGSGAVNVLGNGGSGAGSFSYGVDVDGTNSAITSSGGNVQVTGTGGGSGSSTDNYGIFVGSSGQVSAGGIGTVTVNGTGGASSGNYNYGVYVTDANSTITSGGGDVSVTGQGGGSGSGIANYGVYVFTGGVVRSGGSGKVTVQGTGGNLTGTGGDNYGVLVYYAAAQITSGGGDVSVTGQGGGSGTSGSNFGVNVNGGGVVTSGGGKVTIQGTGGNGSGVANYGVYVLDTGAQITSGGGDVSVTGQGGTGANNYGVLTAFSNTIASGGTGQLTITADSMSIASTAVIRGGAAGDRTVTLKPRTAGTLINLGGADVLSGSPLTLGLSDAELDRVTAGTLKIGDASSGALTISSNISRTNGVLSLQSNSTITESTGAAITFSGSGDLAVRAGGSVDLGNGNSVTTFAGTAPNGSAFTFFDTNDVVLGTVDGLSTVSGGFMQITVNGAFSVSNGFTVNSHTSNMTLKGFSTTATSTIDGSVIGNSVTVMANRLTVNTTTGSVTASGTANLRESTSGVAINLGGADGSGVLGLTDAELDRVTAATLQIGSTITGAITVSADITRSAATALQLTNGAAINFTAGLLNSAGGNISLIAGTSVGVAKSGVDVNAGAGTLAFSSGDDLAISINGTTADTQYDQLNVAGVVNVTGVDLVISGSYVPTSSDTFVIVSNDGADGVIGTFTGLSEGSVVNVNGTQKKITYFYPNGTGNDIALLPNGTTDVGLSGGNLVVTDGDGGTSNDTLTISLNGSNVRITDPNNLLAAGSGATQVNANTIEVPLASITGNIQVNTLGGDDSLTISFAGGNPIPAGNFIFNGGTGGNDVLSLTGAGITNAILTHANANDGSIVIDGKTLTYSGLDPILVNTPGANWVLEYVTDPAAVTLADVSGNLEVSRTGAAEQVTITPAGLATLTIRTGSGADTIEFDSLPAGWSAPITIDGQGGSDIINFDTSSITSTGALALTGIETANLTQNITANLLSGDATTVNVSLTAQIQDGISISAAGATVNVAAGTYTESLIAIDRGLSILGPNAGVNPNTSVRGAEAIIVGAANLRAPAAITINGLKFQNSVLGGNTIHLEAFDGNTTVPGHVITNTIVESTVLGGGSTDRAIDAQQFVSGSYSITNNLVTGNGTFVAGDKFGTAAWREGIYHTGDNNLTINISGNVIRNARTALVLTDFANATSTINGNTIINAGTGIGVSQTTPLAGQISSLSSITNTTFSNADSDISLRNLTGNLSFDLAATGNASVTGELTILLGSSGNDTFGGTSQADYIIGDNSPIAATTNDNNAITGNGGDDIILGSLESGIDRSLYAASLVSANVNPSAVVIPGLGTVQGWVVATGSSEGTDALADVEIVDGAESGRFLLVGNGGFNSIGAAMAVAVAGDTILVQTGTYAEAVTLNLPVTLELKGAVTINSFSGSVAAASVQLNSFVLTTGDATSTQYDGTITGTGGGLTKQGSGTFTLTNANTYTGATAINAGQLNVNGSLTSNVTVNSTATLGGTGTINSANTVSVVSGGTVSPGVTIGILNSGSVTFASGATFSVLVNGSATAGTNYDQLNVTGTVALGTATLNATGTITSIPGQTIVLINNDSNDPVTGTFNGLSEGSTVTINGVNFLISYAGGSNSNDVVLVQAETSVSVSGGNLIVTDTNGGTTNDNLTITRNGSNLRISDAVNALYAGSGAVQINATTVEVPLSSITGNVQVNTLGGNDSLTLNFSGGNFPTAISYDGGGQTTSDTLTLTGGTTFATIKHTLVNASSGSVDITGNSLISYTGLEPVIDNLPAANRIFDFTGGSETITVTDGTAADGMTMIDSTLSESVYFTNATTSITILTTSDANADTVTFTSVDSGFNVATTITSKSNDTANLNAALTLASGNSLSVTSGTISVAAAQTTSGASSITLIGSGVTQTVSGTVSTPTLNLGTGGNAGTYTLTNTGNNAATVAVTSTASASYTDADSFALATSSVGTLNLIAQSGTVTQSGTLSATTLNLGNGGNGATYTLTNAGNTIGTLNSTTSASASVTDSAGGLILAGGNVGGTYTLTTTGGLTQSSAVTTGTLSASNVTSGNIDLSTANNLITNFSATNTATGGSASVKFNAGGTVTGITTSGGAVNVSNNSAGTIAVTGAIATSGGAVSLAGSTTGSNLALGANINTTGGTNAGAVTMTSANAATITGSFTINTDNATGTDGTVSLNNSLNAPTGSPILTVTAGTGSVSFTNIGATNALQGLSISGGTVSVGSIGTANGGISLTGTGITLTGAGVQSDRTVNTGAQGTTAGSISISGPVSLSTGVTFDSDATTTDAAITFANGSTINNAQTLTLNAGGANVVLNNTVIGGTTALASVTVTSNDVTGSGNITTTGGVSVTNTGTASTLSGVIAGTGATLTKSGTGTLTLSGANTYTGGATINAGTLATTNSSALGTAVLTMNGGTLNTSVDLTNNITLNNTTNTIAPNGAYRLLSGRISGAGGFIVANGGGTPGLELNNNTNNFAGNVTINANTFLRLTASEVIPNTASIQNDGNLRLDVAAGGTETIAGLSGSSTGSVWVPTTNNTLQTLVVGSNNATSSYAGTIGAVGQNNAFLALTKIGTGTLSLSAASPYSGGTLLSGGTLSADNDSALGTGVVTLAGGTLRSISGNRTLANNLVASAATSSTLLDNIGGGDLILTGTVTGSGALTVNSTQSRSIWFQGNGSGFAGTINYTNNNGGTNFRLGGSGTTQNTLTNGSDWSGTTFVLSGAPTNDRGISWNGLTGTAVKLGSLAGTGRVGSGNAAVWEIGALGTNTTYSGLIEGTSVGLSKVGAGTLTLSGANTFTGGTTISQGAIVAANSSALSTSGTVTINNAATGTANTSLLIDSSAGSITIGRAISVANQGTGTVTIGTSASAGGNQSIFSGAITLAKAVTLQGAPSGGDRTQFSGGISGTGNVTISNSQRVIFISAANTYTGNTIVNNGSVLQLSDGTSTAVSFIPDASTVTVNGTLNIAKGSNDETIGALAGSGTVQSHPGVPSVATSLTISDGGGSTFSGVLSNGGASGATLSLTKTGAGTQTLSGANTYTGATTINGGTLLVTGSTAAGSAVAVNSTATLGGTGTVSGAVSVANGGNVAPGLAAAIGKLNTGNVTFVSGATLTVAVNGNSTAGTDYDQLNVTGTVNVTGATLSASGTITSNLGQTVVLINNDGTDAVTGTFAGLPEGATVTINGINFLISYTGGTNNNDVVLVQSETSVVVSGGNLVIADVNGGNTGDNLTITLNGTNVRITDTVNSLYAGIGATQIDPKTVEVPLASITGNIQVNTLDGNDTLTLALAGGDFIVAGGLSFAGGNNTDALVITGGTQGTVTYNYTNANDGNIVMSNFGTVTYTGLAPITNSGTAADVIFNLPAGGNIVTLGDDGTSGNGLSRLSSSPATFELTDFSNPTGSVTINGGTGNETFTINAIPDLNASLTIDGQAGTDSISLTANITLGSATSNGNLALTAEAVSLGANINTDASTTGTNGSVNISGPVTLVGNVAIDTDGTGTDGSVSFVNTINADVAGNERALTITAGGANVSTIGIGGTTRLGTFSVPTSGTLSVGSISAGLGGINLNGNTINLNGTSLTNVNAGPISITGSVNLNTGVTASTSGAGNITFGTGSTINGAQTLALTTSTGSVTLNNTVIGGTTPITSLAVTAANLNGSGNITTTSGVTVTNTGTASTLSGVIAGTAAPLTKLGTGTLTISGSNTYGGDTTISAGTLKLGASEVIPNGTGKGNVVLNPSAGTATLDLGGFSETINGLTNSGAGSSVVDNTTGAATYTLTVGDNNATGSFSGVIQNTSGSLALTKTGSAALVLTTATNTYTGGTIVNGGTLQAGNNANQNATSPFGTGLLTVNSGALVSLNPGSSAATFNIPNSIALAGGTIRGEDGVQRLANGVGATFNVGTGGGTVQATWTGKDVFIDGTITGSTTLNVAHGPTGGSAAVVHVTNNASTFSGTVTVNSAATTGIALYLDSTTALQAATVNLTSGTTTGTLRITSPNATTTIAGLVSTGTTSLVQPGTAAGTYTLNINTPTATSFAYSGLLADNTGVLAVTKSGTGTQSFNASTTGNTYSGGTTVNGGVLNLSGQNNGTSSVGFGTVTVNTGANVTANSHNVFGQSTTNLAPLVLDAGTFTPSQFIHLNSLTLRNGGTVNLGTSTGAGADGIDMRTLGATLPTVTVVAAATPATIAARMTIRNNTTMTVANGAAATDLELSGEMVSAGGVTLTKSGAGLANQSGTWYNYAGTLLINGGIFNTGATNRFTAGHSTAKQNTFQVIVDGASWTNTSGAVNRIGNVTLRNGATWALSGASVDWGTYYLGQLSNGSNATVTVDGTSASTINGNGNLRLGPSVDFAVSNATSNASVDLTVAVPLENQTNAQGFAAASLSKSGLGTMSLTAANTYTGTTAINDGTVIITSTGSLADGAAATDVTVSDTVGGAPTILSGTGTINGAVLLNSGTVVAPGATEAVGTIGTLIINNNLTLSAGSTYQADITPPGTSDKLQVSGTINLGNANLVVTSSGTLSNSGQQTFNIIDNTGSTFVVGTFSGLPEGSSVTVNGSTVPAYITYNGGTGNSIGVDVNLNTQPIVDGTNGNDILVIRQKSGDPSQYEFSLNAAPFVLVAANVPFTFNGGDGNDIMVVDLIFGAVTPTGGLFFNGNNGTDLFEVKGTGTQSFAYTPSTTTVGQGSVVVAGSTSYSFFTSEQVGAFGFLNASFTPAVVTNVFSLANGSSTDASTFIPGTPTTSSTVALAVSGSTNAVSFTPLAAWNNTNLVLTGNTGNDAVTVLNSNNAHGNVNATINTGVGTDSITFAGELAVTGDVVLTTVGSISDTNGTANNLIADDVTITAAAGTTLDTSINTLIATNTTSGNITIHELSGLTIIGSGVQTQAGNGAINIDVDAGLFTVNSPVAANGNGSITLNADAGTVDLNALVSSATGAIDISGDSITQDANISTGGNGAISAVADNGSITMDSAASTTAANGSISYLATNNIALGLLTTSGNVRVVADSDTSTNGSISDNNGAANNVVAANAVLTAGSGIGSGNSLELVVAGLAANNTSSGDIRLTDLQNAGLTITSVTVLTTSFAGVTNGGSGQVAITNTGSVTIANNVLSNGNVSITSIDAAGAGQNMTVNANVTSTAGTVTLTSGDDFSLNTAATISGNGLVQVNVDTDNAGSTVSLAGTVTSLAADVEINTGAGIDNVTLTGTLSAFGTGDVYVMLGSGNDTFDAHAGLLNGTILADSDIVTINAGDGSDIVRLGDSSFTSSITALKTIIQGLAVANGTSTSESPDGADQFFVRASTTTPFEIEGDDPTTLPGDVLNVDLTGVVGIPTISHGTPDTSIIFGGLHKSITYREIETLNLSNGVANHVFDLNNFLAPPGQNVFDVFLTSTNSMQVTLDGAPVFFGPDGDVNSMTFAGRANAADAVRVHGLAGTGELLTEAGGMLGSGTLPLVDGLRKSVTTSFSTYGRTLPNGTNPPAFYYDGRGGGDSFVLDLPTARNVAHLADGAFAGAGDISVQSTGTLVGFAATYRNLDNVYLKEQTAAGSSLLVDASSSNNTASLAITNIADPIGPENAYLPLNPVNLPGATSIVGDTAFVTTSFGNFANVTVRGGTGSELIDLVSIDGLGLTAVTLDGDNAVGNDTAADTLRVRSVPATVTGGVSVLGGAGNDAIQIYDTLPTSKNVAAQVVVQGEDGTDSLQINDSGSAIADNVSVFENRAQGITNFSGADDVTWTTTETLVVNTSAAADNIVVDMDNVNNGVVTATIDGSAADDQFELKGVLNLSQLNLQGNGGNDTFGSNGDLSTHKIVPSVQTIIVISGETSAAIPVQGTSTAQPTVVVNPTLGAPPPTDKLNLNLTPVSSQGEVLDTGTGQVISLGVPPTHARMYFNGVEDLDLYDLNKKADIEIGDMYVKGSEDVNKGERFILARGYTTNQDIILRYDSQPYFGGFRPTNKVYVQGRGGNDVLEMNYTIYDAPGSNVYAEFRGEDGNDQLTSGAANDLLVGGMGIDLVKGGGGNDVLWGDEESTLANGLNRAGSGLATEGNDMIWGGDGNDIVFGGGGNDTIYGEAGNDYLNGGLGNDSITGSTGNDFLRGEAGNDTLSGDDGIDIVLGGANDDKVYGKNGTDIMVGGSGLDQVIDDDASEDWLISDGTIYDTDTIVSGTAEGANDAAWRALLNVWSNAMTYGDINARRALITSGSAPLNSGNKLGIPQTISDTSKDIVTGYAAGADWLMVQATDTRTSTILDVVDFIP